MAKHWGDVSMPAYIRGGGLFFNAVIIFLVCEYFSLLCNKLSLKMLHNVDSSSSFLLMRPSHEQLWVTQGREPSIHM